MPFIMSCPSCRNSLTVMESPTAYTVGCPVCRNPVLVPAISPAEPSSDPFEVPPDEPRSRVKRRKDNKEGVSTQTAIILGIGGILVIVTALLIYDSVTAYLKRAEQRRELKEYEEFMKSDRRKDIEKRILVP